MEGTASCAFKPLIHVHVTSTKIFKKLPNLYLAGLLCHYSTTAAACKKSCDIFKNASKKECKKEEKELISGFVEFWGGGPILSVFLVLLVMGKQNQTRKVLGPGMDWVLAQPSPGSSSSDPSKVED